MYGCQRITRFSLYRIDRLRSTTSHDMYRFRIRLIIRVQCALHHQNDVNLKFCRDSTHTGHSREPYTYNFMHLCLLYGNLEKRSCQLFYYCVHMARKTTPLCYVTFYVRCSVFHLGYVNLYVRCSLLDLPTGGSRVLCTARQTLCCSAVRVRMCMRKELPSLELLLV